MPIYKPTTKPLKKLIDNAKVGILIIPDIQREYVWKPSQVIHLIDTLLRGWPFSTLLLWDVGTQEHASNLVPNHPFRKTIVRLRSDVVGKFPETIMHGHFDTANLPNAINMVLDGQQRLQSLLLAFGEQQTGLCLLDKEWMSDMSDDGDHPYRGQHVNNRWIFGKLYFDLNVLVESVKPSKQRPGSYNLPVDISYINLFKWLCPDNKSIGGEPRPDEYRWPIDRLEKAQKEDGKRFLSTFDLWERAIGFKNLREDDRYGKVESLLMNPANPNWLQSDEKVKARDGLHEILMRLAQVQEQDVSCLELMIAKEAGYEDDRLDAYHEAVVDIFSRLNAAGRVLDEQEITFAWIKNKWNQLALLDSSKPAGAKIADELCKKFEDVAKLKDSQAVRLLSHIWVTFGQPEEEKYRLLSSVDRLNGVKMQSMAGWLFEYWSKLDNSFADVASTLKRLSFTHDEHFRSTNLVYAVIIYRIGIRLLLDKGGPQSNNLPELNQQFDLDVLKWMGLTLFGGKWGRKSDEDIAKFVETMGGQWSQIYKSKNLNSIEKWRESFIAYADTATKEKAKKYIEDYGNKDGNYQYLKARPILAIWNFSSPDRNKYYQLLRNSNNRKSKMTIDHLFPQQQWKDLNKKGFLDEKQSDLDDALGNLIEMDCSDNSVKNNRTLKVWLHENNRSVQQFELLKETFDIPDALAAPDDLNKSENVTYLIEAINNRTEKIKKDVINFITSL